MKKLRIIKNKKFKCQYRLHTKPITFTCVVHPIKERL